MSGPMPACGFFLRHVKGMEMNNVEVRTVRKGAQPAFVLEDVKHADLTHAKAQPAAPGDTFRLENVRGFRLNMSRPSPDTYVAHVAAKTL